MGNIPKQFLNQPMRRVMSIGKVNLDARTIELSFSSDAEIERWPGIIEVLSHKPGACDLSRLNDRANVFFNHDPDRVLGVIESARIDADGRGRAIIRFGKSGEAERAWQDVQDGILSKVSVGYRIKEIKSSERGDDSTEICTVTNWEPYEISLVTIPADTSVGIGRSLEFTKTKRKLMEATITDAPEAPEQAPVESKHKIDVIAERNAARQGEQERVRAIAAAGRQYKMEHIAMRAIEEGKTIEETKDLFLAKLNERNQRIVDGSKPIGLNDKECRSFSFINLINALSSPGDVSAQRNAGFELEACAAAAKQITYRSIKGTMVPVDVLTTPLLQRGSNIISITSGSGYTGTGGALVETALLVSSFIDLLRNKTVLMRLVPQSLSGLVGNVDIPKQTTGSKGYWIGEDREAPNQDIDFGLVLLRPKTAAASIEVTRRMLMQPSISVEALVRSDIAAGIAETIDAAGFYGDGTGDAPVGLKNMPGVHTVKYAGSIPTYEELVLMETLIEEANCASENMALIVSPSFKGLAKTTLKFPAQSTNGGPIWEPGNTVNGWRTEVTNQIVRGDVFGGNFADYLIALWGGLEMTVDPYSKSKKGRIVVTGMHDVDTNVRRVAAFCSATKTKSRTAVQAAA